MCFSYTCCTFFFLFDFTKSSSIYKTTIYGSCKVISAIAKCSCHFPYGHGRKGKCDCRFMALAKLFPLLLNVLVIFRKERLDRLPISLQKRTLSHSHRTVMSSVLVRERDLYAIVLAWLEKLNRTYISSFYSLWTISIHKKWIMIGQPVIQPQCFVLLSLNETKSKIQIAWITRLYSKLGHFIVSISLIT